MPDKIESLTNVSSGFMSSDVQNANNTRIENAFDNTLSRDGATPNQMEADFDMNDNDILNVGDISVATLTVNGVEVTPSTSLINEATPSAAGLMSAADKTALDNFVSETFDTVTAAASASTTVSSLRTKGYSSVSDQGGGVYKAVGSEPFHEGKFQSGSQWYELVPVNGWVNEQMFGVTGDGSTDDTSAFQNAINYCVHNSALNTAGQVSLRLVSRQIRVTDTIFITYGDSTGSIHIEGFARPYRNESAFNGCTIVSEVTDRMAVAIDGARHVVLKNFRVEGLANSTIGAIDDQQNTFIDESTWNTALTTAGFTTPGERYAPRAGICVDGYAGTRPGGAAGSGTEPYPVPTLPSYISSGTSGYGRSTSSRVVMEGIGVAGFEVAIAIGPSVDGTQGDYVTMENMLLERNKYGVSVGQSQSRGVRIDKMLFSRTYTVLTNNTHGAQVGRFAAHMNIEGGTCVNFINFGDAASLGPIEITGEAEEVHRIGDVATGGSEEHGWQFSRFKFNFRHLATGQFPANVLDCNNSTAPIKFKNCIFTNFGHAFSFFDAPYAYLEDDCRTNPEAPSTATTAAGRAERTFHNGLAGFVGELDRVGYRHHEITALPYHITDGTTGTVQTYGPQYSQTGRDYCIPIWCRTFAFSSGSTGNLTTYLERPHYSDTEPNSTTFASGTVNTDRTIDATDASPDEYDDIQYGGQPGDVFKSTANGTVLRVNSKDYGTGATEFRLLTNIQVVEAGDRLGAWASGTSYSVGDIVRDGDAEFFQCSVAGVSAGDSTDLAGGSDTGCTWVACTYEIIDTAFAIGSGNCDRASLSVYTTSNPLYFDANTSTNVLENPLSANGVTVSTVMSGVTANDAVKTRPLFKSPTHVNSEAQITVVTAGTSYTLSNVRQGWSEYEQFFFSRLFS